MADNSQTDRTPPGSESPDVLGRLKHDREKTKDKIKRYQQRLRDLNLVIGRLEEDRVRQGIE